jgi:hypothetical protein
MKAQAVEDEFRQEEEADELRGYTEDVSMPGQKFDAKNRQSIRNLRCVGVHERHGRGELRRRV